MALHTHKITEGEASQRLGRVGWKRQETILTEGKKELQARVKMC